MAWSKGSRHSRGYGSAWVKLRETIIAHDFGLCQACKCKGRLNPYRKGQWFAVDHVVPKAAGGADEPGNLQLRCPEHHAAKTEREAAEAQGRTVLPTIGLDGWPK